MSFFNDLHRCGTILKSSMYTFHVQCHPRQSPMSSLYSHDPLRSHQQIFLPTSCYHLLGPVWRFPKNVLIRSHTGNYIATNFNLTYLLVYFATNIRSYRELYCKAAFTFRGGEAHRLPGKFPGLKIDVAVYAWLMILASNYNNCYSNLQFNVISRHTMLK